ncbi:ArsR family transcriptional regulator [Chroococcidiopsis cubana CCALA 043]|jgi:DNA-binding transcriptional ArsR family regulator|uniref:Transcriptional regulator, ArsR family n=2 Tax=Chroococcidiopsis TaxID=54298 RepID=K9TXI3_CHRTP|nr:MULTISPECIES: metalloregulator ArsR/SmtB family transcription factor [Chroococcidiopsis]AFY87108.1 transcriptional regulator, ArsR family [Chroococcidiopsis thermalis PCC 7203]PSB42656.1 ArsR family transcriptional regulator [Cyanosarcina cf. burmensis CCALA 770]PSB59302.1 ArsR family transcriptional regulator [Chroococcidiopsis cubana CCALA 043]URD51974.1 metalloregulator ArsR/SmtB family transcription factor [Chroococcidiopsis sp. CCNUC1]
MSRPAAGGDIFQAIADPTRRALLDRLRDGEQPVKQLAEPFAMSLPAISQHLQVLCEVGLVTQRREGRQRLYQLNPAPLKQVSEWVSHYEQFWQEKLAALGAYLENNRCSED